MKEKPVSEKRDLGSKNNYTLILLNDEVNSFDHVIKSLIEVCGHDPVQAEQCAVIAHFRGNCDVKTGRPSVLTAMKRGLGERKLNSEVKPI